MEKDREGVLDDFIDKMNSTIDKFVTMVTLPEDGSFESLAAELKQTRVGKRMATETVGVLYMIQHAGETDAQPHSRIPRFRAEHLRMMIQAHCELEDAEKLPGRMHFFITDGGKRGNETGIEKTFMSSNGKMLAKDHSWAESLGLYLV